MESRRKFCCIVLVLLSVIPGDSGDSPFIPKERALTLLHRVKRSLEDECLEDHLFKRHGCTHEEVRENVGESRVCEAIRELRCKHHPCGSRCYCTTTHRDCSYYKYYQVGCTKKSSYNSISHCRREQIVDCDTSRCALCNEGYYTSGRICSGKHACKSSIL